MIDHTREHRLIWQMTAPSQSSPSPFEKVVVAGDNRPTMTPAAKRRAEERGENVVEGRQLGRLEHLSPAEFRDQFKNYLLWSCRKSREARDMKERRQAWYESRLLDLRSGFSPRQKGESIGAYQIRWKKHQYDVVRPARKSFFADIRGSYDDISLEEFLGKENAQKILEDIVTRIWTDEKFQRGAARFDEMFKMAMALLGDELQKSGLFPGTEGKVPEELQKLLKNGKLMAPGAYDSSFGYVGFRLAPSTEQRLPRQGYVLAEELPAVDGTFTEYGNVFGIAEEFKNNASAFAATVDREARSIDIAENVGVLTEQHKEEAKVLDSKAKNKTEEKEKQDLLKRSDAIYENAARDLANAYEFRLANSDLPVDHPIRVLGRQIVEYRKKTDAKHVDGTKMEEGLEHGILILQDGEVERRIDFRMTDDILGPLAKNSQLALYTDDEQKVVRLFSSMSRENGKNDVSFYARSEVWEILERAERFAAIEEKMQADKELDVEKLKKYDDNPNTLSEPDLKNIIAVCLGMIKAARSSDMARDISVYIKYRMGKENRPAAELIIKDIQTQLNALSV